MGRDYLFSSESVAAGHPDKIADQISDAILDAALAKTLADGGEVAKVRMACETLVKTGMILIAGEMRACVSVDMETVARQVVKGIGHADSRWGFGADDCAVLTAIGKQSDNIAQGVDENKKHKLGAGDQGMMFGYACRETESLMPAAIEYAHRLMRRHAEVRKNGILPWLGPDAKAQVTVQYRDGKPGAVKAVVLSTQHAPEIDGREVADGDCRVRGAVIEEIIRPVLPADKINGTVFHINPTGKFVEGGPKADCGLTGRKIIVDTYGGAAPHGGGAFSGKDPTKVDRSAAYCARRIAKTVVAADLADKCLVQIAYAIGVAEPVSFMIDTYQTGKIPEAEIVRRVRAAFDLTPKGVIRDLQLWRPIYRRTAAHGHFGREEPDFIWENTDLADSLRED